jgi:hypothetical protein
MRQRLWSHFFAIPGYARTEWLGDHSNLRYGQNMGDMHRTSIHKVVLKYAYLAAEKEAAAARNKQYAKLRAINEYFSDEFWY